MPQAIEWSLATPKMSARRPSSRPMPCVPPCARRPLDRASGSDSMHSPASDGVVLPSQSPRDERVVRASSALAHDVAGVRGVCLPILLGVGGRPLVRFPPSASGSRRDPWPRDRTLRRAISDTLGVSSGTARGDSVTERARPTTGGLHGAAPRCGPPCSWRPRCWRCCRRPIDAVQAPGATPRPRHYIVTLDVADAGRGDRPDGASGARAGARCGRSGHARDERLERDYDFRPRSASRTPCRASPRG